MFVLLLVAQNARRVTEQEVYYAILVSMFIYIYIPQAWAHGDLLLILVCIQFKGPNQEICPLSFQLDHIHF
jgi:hypothetical protein